MSSPDLLLRRGLAMPVLLLLGLIWGSCAAQGLDHGTEAEAKMLAERAATHMQAVGPDTAMADFNDKAAGFIDRDLWVIVFRAADGQVVSNQGVPATLGKDARTLQDADGKFFGKAILDQANSGRAGWVQYRLTNPATSLVQQKSSYVVPVGPYALFVGAYVY